MRSSTLMRSAPSVCQCWRMERTSGTPSSLSLWKCETDNNHVGWLSSLCLKTELTVFLNAVYFCCILLLYHFWHKPDLLCLQEITVHAPLPSGVCGSVAGNQQEMPHLQSGHWDPADPRQLIAPAGSCSFGSSLWFLLPPPAGSVRKLCQTSPLFPPTPLHQSVSLPSETVVTEGSTKHTYIQHNKEWPLVHCLVPRVTAGCQSWLVVNR